ncbi:LCP family protein [Amnibacterium endophyticum]|uniref:LCP family protein n=1 Tax=Amnibacterium endophyticum TaxID=2109337 RepID=A0ABW4LC48_9MICO
MSAFAMRRAAPAPPSAAGTPLRDPDVLDERMMTRRGVWLTVLHLLIPGSAQALAGDRRFGRLALGVWLAGAIALVAAAVLWFVLPQLLLTLPTNAVGLTVVQLLLAAWAVWWLVLTVDTLRLLRLVRVAPLARGLLGAVLAVALVLGLGGAGWGAWAAGVARGTIGTVFGSGRYAMPADGRYNIMLLGGDAGAGRLGLRPDSISVISLDALTGDMVTFGLPRDLDPIPFSAGSPMLAKYPDGYGAHGRCNVDVCQLNSIYTEVELKDPQLYPEAKAQHSRPGIEATRDAVEGALGIPIQYYVLVDMGSFEHLIDALGGVTIDVKQRLPIGGGVAADGTPTGVKVWIEPGKQHLNGNRALWYARSRHGIGNSDYKRMARQRELQQAILRQVNPLTVLTRFERVAKAGSKTVDTDIPQGLLGEFAGLAVKTRGQKTKTIEFVPPDYPQGHPDYERIHAVVQKALR